MIFNSRIKNFLLLAVVAVIFVWMLAMVSTIIFFALIFLIVGRVGWAIYSYFRSDKGASDRFPYNSKKRASYSSSKDEKTSSDKSQIIDIDYEDLTDKK